MSNKGYNYNFKMFMEGIEVPFQSANIICTPNGVEASINMHANEQLLNLKPKTAINIFYKDWFGKSTPGWHLLCDAFLSRFDKNEDAAGGVGVAIQARDFRMDIRKAPAALSYNDASDLQGSTYYHTSGLFKDVVYKTDNGTFRVGVKTFDSSGLNDLAYRVLSIAQTATGGLAPSTITPDQSKSEYYANMSNSFPTAKGNIEKNANGGFFLDAFVRGIWLDAAGGSKLGTFLNKRIRTDKRFMVPVNYSGFNMWRAQNLGILGGEAAMADSQFTSIEAIIMRIAGLFMVRPYSCNTPTLISLVDNDPALPYVMDNDVRNFVVKQCSNEYGPPYMLNSSMLLPPLEFTTPPDCNLIFPPMYNKVVWQYDIDSEITRGYFTSTDVFGTENTQISMKFNYQVPNGLFQMPQTGKDGKQDGAVQEYKANRLTLEERYKGVNVMTGSVDSLIASREVGSILHNIVLKRDKADQIDIDNAKKKQKILKANNPQSDAPSLARQKAFLSNVSDATAQTDENDIVNKIAQLRSKKDGDKAAEVQQFSKVLKHHALLKFLNTRYQGRVITVEMSFNPYIICGFPGIVIADDHGDGIKTLKTMIGMVQQVKHYISRDGEASTSIVMNNVRFIDEPTDIDEQGNHLYCKATNASKAEINPSTLKYSTSIKDYFVGNAKAKVKSTFIDSKNIDIKMYDKVDTIDLAQYVYAKDLLAISDDDLSNGKVNGIYLDDVYCPNKISQFYKAVFKQTNNFMVGTSSKAGNSGPEQFKFMYDSIHEAIVNLSNRTELLNDLEEALSYIKRDVCCEEAFFCGILGLSIDQYNDKGQVTYVTKTGLNSNDKFDPSITRNRYFGLNNVQWNKLDNELKQKPLEQKPGDMSSIIETSPKTAFIAERQVEVLAYQKSVIQQAEAVRFENE